MTYSTMTLTAAAAIPSEPTMGGFAGLPWDRQPTTAGTGGRRELKVQLTVMTDLPEHRVRELANRYAELLAQAVGSKPVRANVTPIGKHRR